MASAALRTPTRGPARVLLVLLIGLITISSTGVGGSLGGPVSGPSTTFARALPSSPESSSISPGPATLAPRELSLVDLAGHLTRLRSQSEPSPAPPFWWTNLSASGAGFGPSPRLFAAMTYDTAQGALLLFGGAAGKSGTPLGDTWTYANGVWTNLTPTLTLAPPSRTGAAMAYYATDQEVVMTGGIGPLGQYYNDTWAFKDGAWTNLTSTLPDSPGGIWLGSLVADPPDGVLLFDGGINIAGNFSATTWEWRDGAWINDSANETAEPGGRFFQDAVYDPAEQGVLYFGGWNDAYTTTNDTWLFRHGVWTNLTDTLPASPPETLFESLVYEGDDGAAVLNGGSFVTASRSTVWSPYTWAFVQGRWENETAGMGASPALRDFAAYATLPTDGGLGVEFGGGGPSRVYSDLWQLSVAVNISASVAPTVVLTGQSVAFHANVTGGVAPVAERWSFGDGATATSANSTHAYAAAGSYNVSLQALDAVGDPRWENFSVEVVDRLSVATKATPDPVDAGQPLDLSVNASGGERGEVNYTWSLLPSGPTWYGPDPTPVLFTVGNYSIELVAKDPVGGTAWSNVSVEVDPSLLAAITSSPSTGAPGAALSFAGEARGGTPPFSLSWRFGDGSQGSGSTPSHTYTALGWYTATLEVGDASGARASTSAKVIITSTGAPLTVAISASPASGAAGSPVLLTAEPAGGTPPYLFAWSLGDGNQSAQQNTSHVYAQVGSYPVVLVLRDAQGSWQNATLAVVVGPALPPPSSGWFDLATASGRATVSGLLIAIVVAVVLVVFLARRKRARTGAQGTEAAPTPGAATPPAASEGEAGSGAGTAEAPKEQTHEERGPEPPPSDLEKGEPEESLSERPPLPIAPPPPPEEE